MPLFEMKQEEKLKIVKQATSDLEKVWNLLLEIPSNDKFASEVTLDRATVNISDAMSELKRTRVHILRDD